MMMGRKMGRDWRNDINESINKKGTPETITRSWVKKNPQVVLADKQWFHNTA
jgi:hypothetical protein